MGIDERAIIMPGAQIGEKVAIGPFSIIEPEVVIGDGCTLGAHVYVANGTRMGRNNQVFHGAILGTIPQHLQFAGEKTSLEIGDGNIIREYCSINRGTQASGITRVGNDCYLMMYVHIAHDCMIGNNVILANSVNMAGHVQIHDRANIGGVVPIHQFVKVGKNAFVGGGYRIPRDVPPFILAQGEPLQYSGPNVVGLKRAGYQSEQISTIKAVYRIIYQSNLNRSQAVARIREELPLTPEVQEILDFIDHSERGII